MSEKSFAIKEFHVILKICETKDNYRKLLQTPSSRFEPSRNSLWKKQRLDNRSMIEYMYETVAKNKFIIKKAQKIQKIMLFMHNFLYNGGLERARTFDLMHVKHAH